MLFNPYTNNAVTSHIVPEISNIPEALDKPSKYHGNLFPPSKYSPLLDWALFFRIKPIKLIVSRYATIIRKSIN